MKLISIDNIVWGEEGTDFISAMQNHTDVVLNIGQLLISEYQGLPLAEYLQTHGWGTIRNIDAIIANFIFNLWIGNYDKKDDDYVVNDRGYCYSVDYDLFGPCFHVDKRLSLGANARAYSMDSIEHNGCCFGHLLTEYMRRNPCYDVSFFNEKIRDIKSVSESRIRKSLSGLRFQWQTRSGQVAVMDNEQFVSFLLERREKLAQTVIKWLQSGMPRKEE